MPCLRLGFSPGDKDSYFKDELRRDMTPCPPHPYFDTKVDTRYDFVPGDLTLRRNLFEEENGLTVIWNDRYSDGQPENNLIR